MQTKKTRILLEDQENNFLFNRSKSNINITFNRIAFIFFILCIISLIYSIHLIHLGSRKSNLNENINIENSFNNLYRADIVDRNGKYLAKTLDAVDIGISTSKVIDKNKLILNLKYIFPNKDYKKIEVDIDNKKFSINTKLGNHFIPGNSTHLNKLNHENFDLQTYKKFLSFLKFQEMMDKYNT